MGTKKRVGINGFGRFSLHLLRDYFIRQDQLDFEIVAINEPFRTIEEVAEEIRFDAVLGVTHSSIEIQGCD